MKRTDYEFKAILIWLFSSICLCLYAHDFEVDGIYYNILSSNEVEVTYKENRGSYAYIGVEYKIPNTVVFGNTTYNVTSIGEFAFGYSPSLLYIVLSSNITHIGNFAFDGCINLKKIALNEGLLTIGDCAFINCHSLSSIFIPNSLTSIGENPFRNCSNLQSISVGSDNKYYDSRGNCNAIIEKSSKRLISGCKNTDIPEGITSIGISAFCGSKKNKIVLPNSVKNIEPDAFSLCDSLESITISENVTSIGSFAFYCSDHLMKVTSKIKNPFGINMYTFTCQDATLYIPKGTKSLYESILSWKNSFKVIIEEEESVSTYSLNITASENGIIAYNGTSIRNGTKTFTVNEGASATITFTPDNGHRIASVKVNKTDVTASVTNDQYTISNIAANTTVDVTFEKNSSHDLFIIASGNGIVTYNKISTRNQTQVFSVKEGTSAIITFTPDNGYRIASVKVNNIDVTSSVVNNQYTVNNITANTTVAVIFEQIPVNTYSLSIKATGNGSAIYNGTTTRNQTQTFTVNEGTSSTITFTPDNGYRIANVKVNNTDMTASVNNGRYTVNNITANTTVAVTFEAIPPTTYTLSVSATGNGSAIYNGTTIRNQTQTFTVNEGTSATIVFTPDYGYRIASVKVNNTDVTASVTNGRYTVNNITANTTVAATFEEEIRAMTVNGVNYTVTSTANRTVNVARGNYGQVLTVPSSFTYQGLQWQVTGMDTDALSGSSELAAVIWNPSIAFPASVTNPNFLLYVSSARYAPSTIKNVVVNGTASSITLTDAPSGNNFYCPQEFTAISISYVHSYSMTTGIGTTQGWETIALPFDVQSISHPTKGTLVPFATWSGASSAKPFWLYQLSGSGFTEASSIKANTPYIISMPNNQAYKDEYNVRGIVTFSASNASVKGSSQLQTATYGERTFVPNYTNQAASNNYYVLNAVNDIADDNGGYADGSMFIRGLRAVHPFEAYLTVSGGSAKAAIPVFEDATTRIRGVEVLMEAGKRTYVYNLNGQVVIIDGSTEGLAPGIYIVNGHKVVIK